MREQSAAFQDAAARAIQIGELYRTARENQEDPWFQRKVKGYLSGEGFYYYPDLDKFGGLSVNPESEWVPADDPDAERKAWLLTAKACQNGHRKYDSGN